MRWGFGMKQGPFELWQEAGWLEVAKMVQEDIDAGKGSEQGAAARLGVQGPGGRGRRRAHRAGFVEPVGKGVFEARRRTAGVPAPAFPRTVCWAKPVPKFETAGTTIERERCDPRMDARRSVLIASIKTKMHAISPEVCEGLMAAVDLAEKDYQGLVIWSGDEPFSAGADLQAMLPAFMAVGVSRHRRGRRPHAAAPCCACATPACRWCRPCAAWRWAVAAKWRCTARAAWLHMESYIGLVEVGVGLVPGAGGLTYIARRAAENAETSTGKDLLPFLTEGFTAAAMAKVGTSALESRQLGYVLRKRPDRAEQG